MNGCENSPPTRPNIHHISYLVDKNDHHRRLLFHNHNHMQPRHPKNPNSTQRFAHNPYHPPPPPPNTIEYNPTTEWPNYLHHHEKQYTSIPSIHNQRTHVGNQQLAQNLTSNILESYSIHVKPTMYNTHP